MPPRVSFSPALFNSSSPWATTKVDLLDLYNSPFTGAVTTRTSLPSGFPHDPTIHQHIIFGSPPTSTSLNTYGYSPHSLSFYLSTIHDIIVESHAPQTKPFIISITGTPREVCSSIATVDSFARENKFTLLVEINLSCPNIPDKPPPAYSAPELVSYLDAIAALQPGPVVPIGLKSPPYTYGGQFVVLSTALGAHPSLISFVTCTNTLGSALHLTAPPSIVASEGGRRVYQPTLSSAAGTGIGGLGGAAVHWLSLGNVRTVRRMLDEAGGGLQDVAVIGVGGVGDKDGWERMLSVGAEAVGLATALGKEGVGVFERIVNG